MKQEKAMDISIKIEEAAITAISIYFLSQHNLGISVWLWILLFFSPDISMLGYLISTKFGAFTYNLFHHRAVALAVLLIGFINHSEIFIASGFLLLGHAAFDRMLGYGLKFSDNFKHTHLGFMGKENGIA
jgi:hypothetical protein